MARTRGAVDCDKMVSAAMMVLRVGVSAASGRGRTGQWRQEQRPQAMGTEGWGSVTLRTCMHTGRLWRVERTCSSSCSLACRPSSLHPLRRWWEAVPCRSVWPCRRSRDQCRRQWRRFYLLTSARTAAMVTVRHGWRSSGESRSRESLRPSMRSKVRIEHFLGLGWDLWGCWATRLLSRGPSTKCFNFSD
jgi:hypothetical protein